jgi:hypothetical protein
MTQKYLYVVDHYVPFPASEYGGIWNVIAENDEECFDLIAAEDEGDYYVNDYKTLKLNINQARTYQLANEVESQIVEEFTT